MGFGNASMFLKIGFVLIIVALVVQILGVALPYWINYDANNVKQYSGLWKGCSEIFGLKLCSDIKHPTDWQEATQALEIIGLLLIIGALAVCIVVIFIKSDKEILKLVCAILSLCACVFIIIGIIIYGAKIGDVLDDYLSGAFAITIIAGIICLVAGVLVLVDWMGKG